MNTSSNTGVDTVRYTRIALSLHWLVAGLILCAFVFGWVMTEMAVTPLKLRMYSWHKWVGITVLALAAFRLLWRLTHAPPPLLPGPAWQHAAAHALHGFLYVMMLVQPITGWIYSNASGYPIVYLGLSQLQLPDLVPRDRELAAFWLPIHVWGSWLLCIALLMHIGAALKHHFIDRDATLRRMLLRE